MNKYKNILLWSTVMLSFFQAANVVCAAEDETPIYSPTNPNQQVVPIAPTHTSKETDSSVVSTEEPPKKVQGPEKPKSSQKKPSLKATPRYKLTQATKNTKKVYLTDELFGGNKATLPDDEGLGGDAPEEEESFYYQLINELVGVAIYGRKS